MSRAIDQVERMIALIPYLKANPGIPVARAAADFGVTPRKIREDVRKLFLCGLPGGLPDDLIELDFEALEDEGVIRIDNADFIDRPMRLFRAEALSLSVALTAMREGLDAEARALVDSALAKLSEALGGDDVLDVAVHVRSIDPAVRAVLTAGIAERRRLRLTYANVHRDTETVREVDPLRMFTEDGNTYLDAWCHRAGGLRKFRADRIARAELTELAAEEHPVPADAPSARFAAADGDHWAVFEVLPGGEWILDHPAVEGVEGAPGRVRLWSSTPDWLRRFGLRHAPSVRVVDPPELVDEIAEEAALALRAYDG